MFSRQGRKNGEKEIYNKILNTKIDTDLHTDLLLHTPKNLVLGNSVLSYILEFEGTFSIVYNFTS